MKKEFNKNNNINSVFLYLLNAVHLNVYVYKQNIDVSISTKRKAMQILIEGI